MVELDSCLEDRSLTEEEIAKEANSFMEYEGCLKNEKWHKDGEIKGFMAEGEGQKHQIFPPNC